MRAVLVTQPGQNPIYGDIAEPVAAPGEERIAVTAAAMSHIVRGRASGRHYSSSGTFPFVVGVDGVGRLADGTRVYFGMPREPFGTMAEYSIAPGAHCIALPDDLDDVTAAALVNPGMSSWAAYTERALLRPGETVLVNGATGAAGRLAVQIARHLGASKVVATGRNAETLQTVGADTTIVLGEDEQALESQLKQQFAAGIDVVVDYLWGSSARTALIAAAKAGRDGVPVRFVQIGSASGDEIALPSAVLRASAIQLMGSGLGSIGFDRFLAVAGDLLHAAVPAGFQIATNPQPLSQVEHWWSADESRGRTVFTTGL